MKKVSVLFIIFAIVFSLLPLAASANSKVQIFLDRIEQHYDQPPIIQEGRTYVPIRHISEAIGFTVDWESSTETVSISKDSTSISFQIKATTALVNGKEKEIPGSFILNDRTMIPVRFVTEQLGLQVDWDSLKRHVYIESPDTKINDQSVVIPTKASQVEVSFTEMQAKQANQLVTDEARMTQVEQQILHGMDYIGRPYQYGAKIGETESFDCSSFIAHLYNESDIPFPRIAADQAMVGLPIPKEEIARGDLLFFDTALNGKIEHVGIYLGNNQMLHVSSSKGVEVTTLFDYWQDRYVVATRN